MLRDILFALWFLLPAAAANAAPVFAAAIPFLKKFDAPLDGGKTFRGRQLLGPHKTWRGIVAGIVVATVVIWLQTLLFSHFTWARYMADDVNYTRLPLLLGPLFALGALGGDAIESFFKRQRGIRSGGTWVPFDQLDYIIGSILVSLFFVTLPLVEYVWLFVIWFVAHIIASCIGYRLGLKQDPI